MMKFIRGNRIMSVETQNFASLQIVFLLLFAAIGSLSAQGLSLDSCRRLALHNNVAVRNAALDVEAAKETQRQLFTKYFPSVTATFGGYYALNPLIEYGIEDVQNAAARDWLHNLYYEYGAALGLSDKLSLCENGLLMGATAVQPVFMGGQIVNGNRLAKIGVEASKLQSQLTKDKVLQQTEETYWQIVSLLEKRKTLQQAIVFLDTLHRDVIAAQQAGLVTQNDTLKVVMKQYEMRSNQLKLENGIVLATMALCQSVGIEYAPDLTLSDTLDKDALRREIARMQEPLSSDNRKEAQLLDLNVQAEQLKKKITVGETLPHLMAGANVSYGNPIFDKYSANGLAFFTLQVPITNWWETSHKIKQQDYGIQKAINNREDLMQKMMLETRQAWQELQQSQAQLQLQELALRDAETNLFTARVNYEAGLVPVADLLEAQTLLRQSQDQTIDAWVDLQIKCHQYKLLTGQN